MKLRILWVILLCGLLGASGQAQPISVHIGSDSLCGPGTVAVPVTVTGFNNVGAFTLHISFDTSVIKNQGTAFFHPAIDDSLLFTNLSPDSTKAMVSWLGIPGQSIPDGDTLFLLYFDFLGGSSALDVLSPPSGFTASSLASIAFTVTPGQVHQASPPAILMHPWDEMWCLGDSFLFGIDAPEATAYQWEYLPPGGSWGAVPPVMGQGFQDAFGSFLAGSAGVYAFRCIVSDYCADTSNVAYLTVNPPPQIQVQIDTTILAGQPAYLSASGGDYYFWSTGSQQPQDTVSPLLTTPYSVTVVDTNYCEATDSGVVVVTSLSTVSLSLGQVSGCGDTVYVPVIGQGLDSVGAFSLFIDFDPAQISIPPYPAFVTQSTMPAGITNGNVIGGQINFHWVYPGTGTAAFPQDTLFWIPVIGNSGFSTLEWDTVLTEVSPDGYALFPLILENGFAEIFPRPLPPIAEGDSVCSGETPELSATGIGTIHWYQLPPAALLHQGTPYEPNITSPGLYSFYVTQTDANGCESEGDTVQLRVYPLPLVDAGLPDTIPFGQAANLSGSASGAIPPYQFSWSPDSLPLDASAPSTLTQPLTQTTRFILEVEDANSCQGIDSVLIVITGGALTIDVLSASPAAACPGDSIQMHLQVSGGNPPFSYFWMPEILFSDPFIANPRMAADSSVRVYIEIGDGLQMVFDSIDILIHPLPEDVAFQGDAQYCPGTAGAPLWLAHSGDSILYELYRDGIFELSMMGLNDTLHFGMFYDSGVYRVLAIDTATGCQRWLSDSAVLEVLEAPVAEMLPDTNMAICLGDAVLLTATQTGGNTFQWVRQPGISSIPTSLSVLNDIPSPPGIYTYTLIVTNADGCRDTSQPVQVQVNALPIASIWAPAELCEDASVLISSLGSAGSGTLVTQWQGSATTYLNNLFTQTPQFQGAPAGSYELFLSVTDSIGCSDADTAAILVNPSPHLNAGPDTTVAYGSVVQLYADSGQNINLSYSWAPANLLNNAGIRTPQTLPLTATTWFNVYTYDTNTICAASDSLLVTVLGSAVNIDSLLLSATAVCPNDTLTLQAFVSGGSGQYTYQWSAGAFPQGDSIVQIVAPSGAGTQFYALTVTDTITGEFDTINGYIQVYSLPVVQFPSQSECEGDSIMLDAILQTPSQAPYTYSWSGPNAFSASGNPVSIPNAATVNAGTYQLLLEDGNGCRVQYQNNVIVRDTPNVTIFSADTLICPAQPAQLQALVTGVLATPFYLWNTTPPQTASNPVVFPQDTTLYTVTVTASNCSATASIQINTLPGVVSYIDTSFCEGDSLFLNGQWYSQPGFFFDSTVTQAGCDSIISIDLSIDSLPYGLTGQGAISLWYPDTLCENDSATLIIHPSQQGILYFLSDTSIPSSFIISGFGNGDSLSFTIPAGTPATSFHILAVDTLSGCFRYLDTLIHMHRLPLPVISITGDSLICQGQSTQLTASGGQSYIWDTVPTVSSASITVSPSATTYYSVTVALDGCIDSAQSLVTVIPPVFSQSFDTICEGDSLEIAGQYYSQSGTYNDTLVASSGCDSIVSVHLTIYPAPWAILPAIPSVSNCTDSLVDSRDGRIYETTLIGNQCWMAENLNYGTMIPSTSQMANNGVAEKYCYANQVSSCNNFGGLYQWEELMQYASTPGIQGICPPGWHIPTDNEWKVLEGRVDAVYGVGNAEWDNAGWRGYDAGYQLKDSLLWANFGGGINSYGFTAKPGGNLNASGSFIDLIMLASFWTSTVDPATSRPFRRLLNWSQNRVFRSPENPGAALSVRCVKDTLINPPGAIQIWHSDSICETEEAYIHILSSQPGVEYFLYDTNTPPAFTDVGMGNGDTLTFIIPPYTAPGAYEILAMDMAFGCERLLDTLIEIVVTPLPQVSLTQDTAICYGNSITLVAGGGQHYAWNTMPPAFGSSLTIYPTLNYQYTVTVTTNGCSDSASVWVGVLPLSYDTVYAEICEGDTFFFENYPYTQAGIFTDTLISSNGCDSILSLNLSVHPLPYGLGAAVAVVPGCASPMVDPRDGKSYDIVQIGTQCWMAESLNYGTMIPLSTGQSNNALAEKYCYDNIPANCDLYGGLYTWDEMMAYSSASMNQGLCPPGWRIPTDTDWKVVEGASDNVFGPGNAIWDNTGYRGADAGYRWKSLTGWNSSGQGNNALGFNVYASGQAQPLSAYQNQGTYAHFWSSSSGSGTSSGQAWKRELNWNQSGVGRLLFDKGRALAVRCLKDSLFSSVPVLSLQHGDSLCSYDSLYISLENSQAGILYTLIETQSLQSFSSPQAGNGGTLVFAVPPAFTGGYFEIIAEDTLHFCTRVLDSLIHITVLPDPQVSISPGDTTLCAGESITMIATGGGTYQWTNGPQTAQNTVTPPMTTQYAVFVTLDGCSAMDSITISVTPLPVPLLHPDTAICAGDSIQLWASGGSQYFWSPGAGLSQQDITDPWASPATTTMYYLTVTEQNCSAEDSMLIEVHPLPMVTAGPDTSICAGESLEIYASGGSTYEWNTVPPQFGDTILVQPSSSYLYEVSVTDSNGCSNQATVQVSVNPVPLVDAGIDVTIAYGSDTILYGSASGSSGPYLYSWNPLGLLNNPALAQPSTLPMTANTTFYLSVTDGLSGCGGIDSMTVFITGGPMQVDSFSANPDGICPGDSSSLVVYVSGGTGQYFYQWEILNGPVIGQDSLVQVSPATTTDYRCIVTDSLRWDTVYVSVEVFPNPVLVLSPDTNLCPGDTITLTASGGSWYRWDSLPLSQASQILWQANAAGAVVVETIDTNGCTALDSIQITLLPLPQIQTIISNPVCEDNLIALLSDIVPGGGTVAPYQALWTGPSGFNAQIYDTVIPSAQLTMEGMYYFSLTDGNGCRVEDSGYVTVYPLPQLTMSVVPNGVCEKDTAFLITATPWPGGTFTGPGLQNNFNGTAWFRPWIAGAGGPYDLTYLLTDTNGCTADTTAYILVHPQPDAEIIGLQASYCVNDLPDTLYGQPFVGGVFTGPGITNLSPGIALFDPALAGSATNLSIQYSYLDVTGCGDDTAYTTNVLPQPVVITAGDTALCFGDTTTISASGGSSYQWSPAAGLSSTGIANPQASPGITTTYYVTVTENGCSSVDSVSIVILPLPPAFAGNDTFYCAGDSVHLTASGGISYLWSNGLVTQGITVAPTTPTLYGVTVSDGICNASDTVQVSPIALPVAYAGSDSSLCAGDSLQLQASGGSGYLWSPALSLSQSNIDNPFAFPTTSTMYFVTVSDQGCSAADSVFIEVIPLPIITISQDTTICAGDTALLEGGGGGTYAWSPQAALSAPNASQTLAFPTVTTLYTLTVEENGCSSSAGVNVVVQALPPANAGMDTAYCVGDSVLLTGSGGLTYLWSTGATTASIYVQPTDTVYYYLSVSDGLCEASDSVRVHPKLNPVADAGPDTLVCLNDSVALLGQGGTSWLWAPATGLSSATVAQPMASPAASGFYYLTVSENGCTGTDSVYVEVLPLPPADAGQDTSICAGATAILTASGGTSYTWSTIPVQTSAQINVSPANTTTYYVSVSDGQCSAVDSVTVTVDALPQIVLSQDTAICEGDDAVLTVSGGGTYLWSTVPASTASQVTVSPANTTTYYVSVSIGLCEAVDSVEVEVIPLPLAEAGPDTSFCAGDSILLNAGGGTQYIWSPASGLSSVNVFNPWASPAASQMYYVTVSALGCSASDSVYLTVIPLPVAYAGPDTSICPGIPLQLSGSGGTSYQWAPATFLDDPLIANPVATLNAAQTFYLTATENGCSASDSIRVDMHPLPLLTLDPSNPEICAGASIVLTASGGQNYQWSPATGLSATTGAVVIASPGSSTLYTLSGENAFGCIDSIDVPLTVHPPPVILASLDNPVICRGETVEIQASGAHHWQWYPKTGLNSDTAATVIASPSWSTVYTLVGFTAIGCSDTLEIDITVLDRINLDLGPNRHYCNGEEIILETPGDSSITYIEWQDGSSAPFFVVTEPGTYWVYVDNGVCPASDTLVLFPCTDIWIPNAFTPNGDGLNEFFEVKASTDLYAYEIWIFNRWGEVVYNATNIQLPWDGRFKGEDAPIGVYNYVIEYTGRADVALQRSQRRTGKIVLLR